MFKLPQWLDRVNWLIPDILIGWTSRFDRSGWVDDLSTIKGIGYSYVGVETQMP